LKEYGPSSNFMYWSKEVFSRHRPSELPSQVEQLDICDVLFTLDPYMITYASIPVSQYLLTEIVSKMKASQDWGFKLSAVLLISSWKRTLERYVVQFNDQYNRYMDIQGQLIASLLSVKLMIEDLDTSLRNLPEVVMMWYLATNFSMPFDTRIFSFEIVLKTVTKYKFSIIPEFLLNVLCAFSGVGVNREQLSRVFLPVFFNSKPSARGVCRLREVIRGDLNFSSVDAYKLLKNYVLDSDSTYREIWLKECPKMLEYEEILNDKVFSFHRYRKFVQSQLTPVEKYNLTIPKFTDPGALKLIFITVLREHRHKLSLNRFNLFYCLDVPVPTKEFLEQLFLQIMTERFFWIKAGEEDSGRPRLLPSPLMPLTIWKIIVLLLWEATRFNIIIPFVLDVRYYQAAVPTIHFRGVTNHNALILLFEEHFSLNTTVREADLKQFNAISVLKSDLERVKVDKGLITRAQDFETIQYHRIIELYYADSGKDNVLSDSSDSLVDLYSYRDFWVERFYLSAAVLRDTLHSLMQDRFVLAPMELYQVMFAH